MEFRIIILSIACFSCLVPPALGTGLLATAAAVKGAAVLGAGALAAKGVLLTKGALLAKGALIAKLAAITAVKGAAIKGAALLASGAAAKGIALGGAAIAAKTNVASALISQPAIEPVIGDSVIISKALPAPALVPVRTLAVSVPPLPSLKDKVSAVVGATKSIVDFKSSLISRLLGAIKDKVDAIPEPQPIVYQILTRAQPLYRGPVLQVIQTDDKK